MVWKRLCLLSGAWSFPFLWALGTTVALRIATMILFVARISISFLTISIIIFNKRKFIAANSCFYIKKLKIKN